MLEPGAALLGKYKVTRLIGEGGMGCVYEAIHETLGTPVAIKVLRDEALVDKEAVARFSREARAAAVLRGPHTARVFDVGELAGGQPFMVMEMLQGQDLGVELERRVRVPVAEAVGYVIQACEAIAEAHELGIVHRDLKPANIFLARAGSRTIVKILDFGISRMDTAGESRVTQTQSAFGTPLYMAPEAIRSAKHTDARADVWALGIILYELLSGTTPFLGDTPTSVAVSITVDGYRPVSELSPDVPAELDAVIARVLEKDPARRIQTVGELSAALAPFAEPAARNSLASPLGARASALPPEVRGTLARTGPAAAAEPSRPRSQRAVAGIAVGLALVVGAGAGGALYVFHRAPHAPAGSEAVATEASDPSRATLDPDVRREHATAPETRPLATSAETASAAPPSATPLPSASSSAAPVTATAATAEASSIPTLGAPTEPRSSAPPQASTPHKPPTLAPSTPGGNPLIL